MASRELLIVENNIIEGFLRLSGYDYKLYIVFPLFPSLRNPIIKCEWSLKQLMLELNDRLLELSASCDTTDAFLSRFLDLVNTVWLQHNETHPVEKEPVKCVSLYSQTLHEIEEIHGTITEFNNEHVSVQISYSDIVGRVFLCKVKLSYDYPRVPGEIVHCDIPQGSEWPSKVVSLTALHKTFIREIEVLREYFHAIDQIDNNCWVIDPESPCYFESKRRIVLSDTASVLISFNPFNIKEIPQIQLFGSEVIVEKMRSVLEDNLQNDLWDPDTEVLFNLEAVLGISSFPSRPTECELDEKSTRDCAICYMLRRDDEVTSITCENKNCLSLYHNVCLFEWLLSITSNRPTFDKLVGECPNCNESISCQIP